MRYVFGFAGLQVDVYDKLRTKLLSQTSDVDHVIGRPLAKGAKHYGEDDVAALRRKFAECLAPDAKVAEPTEKAYCLICVTLDQDSTQTLVREFFPEILVITVLAEYQGKTGAAYRSEVNKLIVAIESAIIKAKKALKVVHKEVTERANRTPLLLPVKNFKSKTFVDQLHQLYEALADAQRADEVVRQFIRAMNNAHPVQTSSAGALKGRERYVDDRGIHFVPPGKHRHAFLRHPDREHTDKCFLTSHLRLGAPYHAAFHYDCQKGLANLKGDFFGCHTDACRCEGRPHLNIATNDYVRT